MKFIRNVASLFFIVLLVGCASQQKPIALNPSVYNDNSKKIGIIRTVAPKAETLYTGSIGLLDYAIISGVNSGLDDYLATLTFPEYEEFVAALSDKIKAKGANVVLISEPLTKEETKNLKSPVEGISKTDFSRYKDDVDLLLVLNFKTIGTTRAYYGPVPLSAPLANTHITGQLIDLSTNQLLWYADTAVQKVIPEPWDEPGNNYPNLTNNIYLSLDEAFRILNFGLIVSNTKE